jgi:hypothetical protein
MAQPVLVEIEMPGDLAGFRLPEGVHERLQSLLDRQESGADLTPAERREAEGLVNLSELLSLLKLRARRAWGKGSVRE